MRPRRQRLATAAPGNFLGLDLGTTNVKAVVAGPDGEFLGVGSSSVELFHVSGGGVEQDIEQIWCATLAAISEAVDRSGVTTVAAVGISSQGGALQLQDARGRPLGRVVSWLDDRGHKDDDALTAELGRDWFRQRIGHGRSGLAIGQLQRLRRAQALGLRPSNRIGFVGDSIVERLCGTAGHDATSCGLTLLYNPAQRDYDPELLSRLELRPSQLPPLLSPRAPAGRLLPAVARQTGLPVGIPVSVAIHDQYAAALGTGTVRVGEVMFGAGTAWVLLAVMGRLTKPVIDDAFVCNHVVEDLYGQIISLRNGGSALGWALKLTGREGLSSAELDEQLRAIPAGSDGLCFWPFLTAYGASELRPGIQGRITGLQLSHTPVHLLRAVVEGLACELNRHLLFLKAAGLDVRRLVMSGGAAASRVTPQIIADVTGVPVACSTVTEGSLLGAVILARGLVEPEHGLADLAALMVPATKLIRPGSNAASYRRKYEDYAQSLVPFAEVGSES